MSHHHITDNLMMLMKHEVTIEQTLLPVSDHFRDY